ncbi:MAG: tetratricopeptide repeat protein [Deltaproteobacteria bacterium]|nr:tetratricopeptide repeat protein [Deltaproteobacteria bacterium]
MSETPTGYQAGTKREGAGSALVQIILVGALAGGGLFFYKGTVKEKERISNLSREARTAARQGDAPGLLEAKVKFIETGKDKEDPRMIAELAEISALLYYEYGMADQQAVAEEYVALAKEMDLKKESRFAAEVYLALAKGQADEGERIAEDFAQKYNYPGKIMHALAESKLMQGKAGEAQMAAEQGMKVAASLIRLPLVHGDAFLAQGKFGAAEASYRKAAQMNAGHLGMVARNVRLVALRRSKKPKYIRSKDIEIARGQLSANSPRISALLTYAEAESYYSEGKVKKALKIADKALQENDRMFDALLLKGRSQVRLKRTKGAVKSFDALLKAVPTSLTYAQTAFEFLNRVGKGKEGINYLEGVKTAAPDNNHVYPALSVAYSRVGNVKKATEMAKISVEKLGNASDEAVFATARALQADGKGKEAIAKYQEAVGYHKAGMKWPEAYYALGQLSVAEKDLPGAETSFVKAGDLWETSNAPIDIIVDAYSQALEVAKGQGRKAKPRVDIYKKKIKKLLKGG